MSGTLEHLVRPAAGQADGALVLFHGRGASEDDLYPLLDADYRTSECGPNGLFDMRPETPEFP